MNRKIYDEHIDTMLKNYCRRKGQVSFEFNADRLREKSKYKRVIHITVPVIALLLVFGVAIFSAFYGNNSTSNQSTPPSGFTISVSASEREPVKLGGVEVMLNREEGVDLPDITFENGMVSLELIWFDMTGENIDTFDYRCENGLLFYVLPDLKEKKLNGDTSITQDDYFKKGQVLESVPYDSKDPNSIFVSWHPNKLDTEEVEYLKSLGYSQPFDAVGISDILSEFRSDKLKNSEDFNYYFGDTITITAHYKDGTSETAVVDVSVDIRAEDDKIYGYYVLNYK